MKWHVMATWKRSIGSVTSWRCATLVALCLCIVASAHCSRHEVTRDVRLTKIEECGGPGSSLSIDKVVALETRSDSLLGTINRVVIVPGTQNILVFDIGPRRPILEFSATGRFLGRYPAPNGIAIKDFAPLPNGQLAIVAGNTINIVGREGTVRRSKTVEFAPTEVATVGARLYVRAGGRGRRRSIAHAVQVFDLELRLVGSFHPWESRLDNYALLPSRTLVSRARTVCVADALDPQVSCYDADGSLLSRLSFSVQQVPYAIAALSRAQMTEADRSLIKRELRRIARIAWPSNAMVLLSLHRASGSIGFVTLDPNNGVGEIRRGSLAESGFLGRFGLNEVVGEYADGLIATVSDPQVLEKPTKPTGPPKSVSVTPLNNPFLAFFRVPALQFDERLFAKDPPEVRVK